MIEIDGMTYFALANKILHVYSNSDNINITHKELRTNKSSLVVSLGRDISKNNGIFFNDYQGHQQLLITLNPSPVPRIIFVAEKDHNPMLLVLKKLENIADLIFAPCCVKMKQQIWKLNWNTTPANFCQFCGNKIYLNQNKGDRFQWIICQ